MVNVRNNSTVDITYLAKIDCEEEVIFKEFKNSYGQFLIEIGQNLEITGTYRT